MAGPYSHGLAREEVQVDLAIGAAAIGAAIDIGAEGGLGVSRVGPGAEVAGAAEEPGAVGAGMAGSKGQVVIGGVGVAGEVPGMVFEVVVEVVVDGNTVPDGAVGRS